MTYWTYKSGLIQTYTLPYVRLMAGHLEPGRRISLVTFEQPGMALTAGERDAALAELQRDKIDWISLSYNRFSFKALLQNFIFLVRLVGICRRAEIATIHCFCTPAGAIGYFLSLLTGIPLVIDSYEPHAEAMVENGTWTRSSLPFKLLFFLEALQSRRASAIVATTEGMRGYAKAKYGAEFTRFYVKPACVDVELFKREGLKTDELAESLGLKGKIVCIYAGKIGGIYLEREIFDLLKAASDRWGNRFRAILLTDAGAERMRGLCAASGFDYGALIHLFVNHREIPPYMALADFALTPVRPVPSKRLCAPIKDGEYWAMGLPVIITADIAEDSAMIEQYGIGVVLRGFSGEHCARAIGEIEALLQGNSNTDLHDKIRGVAVATRGMGIAKQVYDGLYG